MKRFFSEEFLVRAIVVSFLVGVMCTQMDSVLHIAALNWIGFALMAPLVVLFVGFIVWGCSLLIYDHYFRRQSVRAILQQPDPVQAINELTIYLRRKRNIQEYAKADNLLRIPWSLSNLMTDLRDGYLDQYLYRPACEDFYEARQLLVMTGANDTVAALDSIEQYYGITSVNNAERKEKIQALKNSGADDLVNEKEVRALADKLRATFNDACKKAVSYLNERIEELENPVK
ncbi:MAG: hypothetical protein ACAI35_03985 [Candidatus Methylacidiphilales bacterium]|nr:YbaB/EbfC family nucleoid-associated protein [Candidatus Methylacidiphilales bacterium]